MTDVLKQALARAEAEGWSDWITGPWDHHALESGHYFDVRRAEHAKAFFSKYLKHTSDRFVGQPFDLLDWQYRQVVGRLVGWRKPDGRRRFTKGLVTCAKKNGKSGLISGLALYLLLSEGQGTQIFSAACDRQQASILFNESAAMVRAHRELAKLIHIRDSTKNMIAATGGRPSIFRALSADAKTKEGLGGIVLCDELHAWPGRELYDALVYAGSALANPLLLVISTVGWDMESVMGEEYGRAKRWLAGDYVDDSYFAVIHEAPKEADWQDEKVWALANPSLAAGVINIEQMRADALEAADSPAKQAAFRRYRLNQWVQTADAWLDMDKWDQGNAEIDAQALEGRPCYAGLDLSATDDTTSLVLIFPEADGSITVLPWFYLPKDNIDILERKHRVSYRAWSKAGHMHLTSGNVVDYGEIRQHLGELRTRYRITQLAIDRKFQGQGLESDLIADGFDVVPAGQGWISQDLPAKELERLIKAGKLNHGGHPVLRWHASNAVVDIDKAQNYSLNKKKARSKIDGIAATLMALLLYMRGRPADQPAQNYYENHDLITLDW